MFPENVSSAPNDEPGERAPNLRVWLASRAQDWDRHWKGRDHRYGDDFAAFVGEALLTDFELRDLGRDTPEPAGLRARLSTAEAARESDLDLLEAAWGLIANAGGSNWSLESRDWQDAAARWRDKYYARLELRAPPGEPT
ncbi:MAG: hypothetical protein ACHQWU_16920 [Gemmatimonadales bacterium]